MDAVDTNVESLGIEELKPEQRKVIDAFMCWYPHIVLIRLCNTKFVLHNLMSTMCGYQITRTLYYLQNLMSTMYYLQNLMTTMCEYQLTCTLYYTT